MPEPSTLLLFAGSAVALVLMPGPNLIYIVTRSVEAGGRRLPRPPRHQGPQGMLVNLLNPKVSLFFLALLPQFVDPARGAPTLQVLVLGLVFLAIAGTLDLLFVLAAGRLGPRLRGGRRWSGVVYLALAALAAAGSPRRPA